MAGGQRASGLRRQLKLLLRAPTELRILYVLNFLNSYKYFSMALVLPIIATTEYGFSDVTAGALYNIRVTVRSKAHKLGGRNKCSSSAGGRVARSLLVGGVDDRRGCQGGSALDEWRERVRARYGAVEPVNSLISWISGAGAHSAGAIEPVAHDEPAGQAMQSSALVMNGLVLFW